MKTRTALATLVALLGVTCNQHSPPVTTNQRPSLEHSLAKSPEQSFAAPTYEGWWIREKKSDIYEFRKDPDGTVTEVLHVNGPDNNYSRPYFFGFYRGPDEARIVPEHEASAYNLAGEYLEFQAMGGLTYWMPLENMTHNPFETPDFDYWLHKLGEYPPTSLADAIASCTYTSKDPHVRDSILSEVLTTYSADRAHPDLQAYAQAYAKGDTLPQQDLIYRMLDGYRTRTKH